MGKIHKEIEMETVKVKINDRDYMVGKNSTILEACKNAHIDIPSLCYMKGIAEEGGCGLCIVEIKGQRLLKRACITKVTEGMQIYTNTEKVRQARKMNLALLLSNHKIECPICDGYLNCELRKISERIALREAPFDSIQPDDSEIVLFNDGKLKLDNSKCILCQRCVNLCGKILGAGVMAVLNRAVKTKVGVIEPDKCIGCGQCYILCPTGAIQESSTHFELSRYREIAIDTECFKSLSFDKNTEKKFITALKELGFEKIYSFNELWSLCVDKTVEEIKEKLLKPKKSVITTVCPSWQKYIEIFYPEFLNISAGFHPVKLLDKHILPVVSCFAISNVITMNQLLNFVKQQGIDIKSLPPSEYDRLYERGESFSGDEFIKKILQKLTNSEKFNVTSVRGLNKVKEIKTISSPILRAAVTDSLYQARILLERIKKQKSNPYQIIHVMVCPEGCSGGGGMPQKKNISGSYYGFESRKRFSW